MKLFFTTIALVFSLNSLSHGDHSMPGALPVAPHGGALFEVEHKGEGHGNENKDKKEEHHEELYFEGKNVGNTLEFYPLVLDEKNKTFKKEKASDYLIKKIELKYPRSKKEITVKAKTAPDHFVVDLPRMRDRRVVVEIDFKKHGEDHEVKLQIEITNKGK